MGGLVETEPHFQVLALHARHAGLRELFLQKVCRGNHGAHQKTLLEPILVRNVRKREEGVQIRIDLAMDQEV